MARTLILLTVAAALPSSASAATSPEYYGLNVQSMFRLNQVDPARWDGLVTQMQDAGMKRARVDATWRYAQPGGPTQSYTWSRQDVRASLDDHARVLARRGIRMVPVLATPPAWAAGPGTQLRAEYYDEFAAFAAAYVGRYGPDGTFWRDNPGLPVLPPHEYEFWTEVNSALFWTGAPSAPEYVKALRLISEAVHGADPTAKVLASLGWHGFEGYTRQMFAAGAGALIDGVAFHPYAPHAPAVLNLTTRMRRVLDEVGGRALPLYLTETGQPVTYSSKGGPRAGSGVVSDAARAATQALTGDALARSDCDVRDYHVYSIIGTESHAEPVGEGYMGVMRFADGTPNATGAAVLAASRRWNANVTSGVVLCGTGTTPPDRLLPLGLTVNHVRPTCVTGATTYFGNPLEAAHLTLVTGDGRVSRYETDAFGFGEVCIPNGPPIYAFDVIAEIPNVAMSPRYRCTVPVSGPPGPGSCVVMTDSTPLPSAAPRAAAAAKRAPSCRWQVKARIVRIAGRKVRTEGALRCRVKAKKVSFSVAFQRGAKRTKLRKVSISPHGTTTFTLPRRLASKDSVVLQSKANAKLALPALAASGRTIGGVRATGTEGCDWKLETRVLRPSSATARTKVRARLTCLPPAPRSGMFTVAVLPRNAKRAKVVRRVTLRGTHVSTFTVTRRVKRGDRVVLEAPASATLPKLSSRAAVTSALLPKR